MNFYFGDDENVVFSRREFLNLDGHNSTANIVTNIRVGGDKKDKETGDVINRYITCLLDLADCDRKISLSIELDTEKERLNALHKVRTMINVLTDFEDAIKKESEIQSKIDSNRDICEKRDKLKEEQEREQEQEEENSNIKDKDGN